MGTLALLLIFLKQLYMVPVQHKSVFITAVYSILERKSQVTYEEMFNIISNECKTRGMYPAPRYLHLDFELAVINAVKIFLLDHVTINGCFVSFMSVHTHRKAQKLYLETIYKLDGGFRKYCGMIDSLAFMPLDKVLDGMKRIYSTSYRRLFVLFLFLS